MKLYARHMNNDEYNLEAARRRSSQFSVSRASSGTVAPSMMLGSVVLQIKLVSTEDQVCLCCHGLILCFSVSGGQHDSSWVQRNTDNSGCYDNASRLPQLLLTSDQRSSFRSKS
ncbi:Uncharacterized protein Fot_25621 [Forsythia ovata]|uniref:Uncharacterized protein n=1 Tax=Forsythia ovata TaxID=205694 RepID=A0ABD1U9J6_9LAMI